MKKIVVLGGGIAGIEAAIFLRKYNFDVELISDRDYLFIYPISIWLPTREKNFNDVIIPIEELSRVHGFKFIKDKVIEVNKDGFILEKGGERKDFDYLIVAIGQEKLKHKGLEYTYSICGNPQEIISYTEKLNEIINTKRSGKLAFGFGGNPKAKEAVRGGPVFEILFNVDHYLRKLKVRDNFELIFFAPMPKPGERLGETALKMMDMMFKRLNIKSITGKKIVEFLPDGIVFEDGTKIDSDLTLFVPAGEGHTAIKNGNLPKTEAGFILIERDNRVKDCENIYAIGDCVALEGPEWKAKQGHIAEVMARNTAFNIALREGLEKGNPKTYVEHINILCLMDMGNGGALAYRDNKRAMLIPLPIIGHWMKKGWGVYYKLSKLGKIPRLPGM
ncbi:NAD(P)/FAD-dependent oxidoreductase [Thermocrinis minervae]|uniref:Sulfide:quinone oxidoreductase n=1 Tax=Thermocrinis minervae TaxID=381751 RepID=A0A1M6Q4J4_9AQUI|nr:FAD-dependent oxidoreductase [Thermocrinis minervae]SHK15152.1 sulfide:quinone oxidoreductase [Thermocrinis minervae]